MIYVKRNDQLEIIDLEFRPLDGYEEISLHSDEISEFINHSENSSELIQQILNRLDLKMIRVIEDVIDILIKKNVMLMTELPTEVQNQLLFKRRIRSMTENDSPIHEEDDELIML